MIVCGHCGEPYPLQTGRCAHCSHELKTHNGVTILAPHMLGGPATYDPRRLDRLFEYEQKHFWFVNRKQILKDLLIQYVPRSGHLIEIGAGTGDIATMARALGFERVCVGEPHLSGLDYAGRKGIAERYQMDVMQPSFVEEFDAVGMFDVLEHLADADRALDNVNRMLLRGGVLLLTVPAHRWLWSQHDVDAGHVTRYTKHELHEILEKNGFELAESAYVFASLVPLMLLRRFLHPARQDSSRARTMHELHGEFRIPPIVNGTLKLLGFLERSVSRFYKPPVGGSLYAVARKAV